MRREEEFFFKAKKANIKLFIGGRKRKGVTRNFLDSFSKAIPSQS